MPLPSGCDYVSVNLADDWISDIERTLPPSVSHSETAGPGAGWGLRRRARRHRVRLEQAGYVVTLFAVGRVFQLRRAGLIREGTQDGLGMGAVLKARRQEIRRADEGPGGDEAGVREPRGPRPNEPDAAVARGATEDDE